MRNEHETAERPPGDDPAVPDITADEFIRWIAAHPAPDDDVLSAGTLRAIIGDFRMHARRLLGQDAKELAHGG